VARGRIAEHGGAANLLEPLLKIGAVRVVGPTEAVVPGSARAGSARAE
jgi:hypothetical protein